MNKLRLGDLKVESFLASPDVKEMELNSVTYTVVGTCCGEECTGGTTVATGGEE